MTVDPAPVRWQRWPGQKKFNLEARKQQFLNLVVAIDVSDSTDTQPLRKAFATEHDTACSQSPIAGHGSLRR